MVSAPELDALRGALRAVSDLSDADLAALPPPQRRALQAGEPWLRAGERATQVGFVADGGLREYYVLPDGTERTKSFNLRGDFAGSLADLLSGQASRTWVVAEKDTVVLALPWAEYDRLSHHHPAWMQFSRRVAEGLYVQKVQREYELLALDAQARLDAALARWPDLDRIFSQRDIASYVGITPVHLSRLRARRRATGR